MHESRLEREKNISHTMGFVEGLECTKDIITSKRVQINFLIL